jgi:hypothetical protein
MLEQFNKQYKYKSDKEKYCTSLDIWEIIKPNKEGIYEGDCESYCRTLKHLDWQFKYWDYYYCKLDGVGHCVLYKDAEIIDCNTQKIVYIDEYCKMYKVTEFKKYNWFVVFSKILFARGYVWIKSLKS